jgi:hypothetical protein
VIVGGVAVNLYGYSRFTGDIDIIISLSKANLEKFDKLMHKLGYIERQPVHIKELGNSKKLKEFIDKKGLKAFTFVSAKKPLLDIDIIVQESMDFQDYYERKNIVRVWGIALPVCHIDDLIDMKKTVSRDKDLLDIEALLKLKSL